MMLPNILEDTVGNFYLIVETNWDCTTLQRRSLFILIAGAQRRVPPGFQAEGSNLGPPALTTYVCMYIRVQRI
jgi:hypothetical protein